MKNLVIVESPTKSKTIEKYLGSDYHVISSKGHIRDLATSGKGGLGVDVENNFTPNYIVSKDKKDVVKELKAQAKKVDKIFLASDPDREGEAIAYHLASVLGLDIQQENRVVFNEITKKAILKAFESPRKIDYNLFKSQETRRIVDRIIGFKLSGLLQRKIKSKSAGRVQSVALKLIVEREREIEKFVSEQYFTIEALFDLKPQFKANLLRIDDKPIKDGNKTTIITIDQANQIIEEIDEFLVKSVKKSIKNRKSKPPFITSSLQQEASNKLNFSPKKTMSVAQKLYEGISVGSEQVGLITYMRSDSYRLSDDFCLSTKDYIKNNYGEEYVGSYFVKKNKDAQDAHEAIRVTDITKTPDLIKQYLSNDEYKLYSFIYYRCLSCLMADAKTNNISVELTSGKYLFTASGSTINFDGYLKVYNKYEADNDVILPPLVENEVIKADKITALDHVTKPASRYNEATLIKELEDLGIGRPSTYASIIDTLSQRAYVELKKESDSGKRKFFFPTSQGILTSDKLQEFFSSIINVKYTSHLEEKLDMIATDQADYLQELKTFYQDLEPLVEKAYENMDKLEPVLVGRLCPQCGNPLVERVGRYGKFIACGNYPECKYIEKKEKEIEYVGRQCPDCGNELVYRKGRFGKFVACSGYPKCKHVEYPKKEKNDEKDS
ncbi:MAG: type I DNA topoisomerase [Erysipelotrichaceae bacterium]